MFNSGSDKRTSSLASGSFHCWLHPRCVHICPPGHYVLRWKNKQHQQVQEPDLQTAGWQWGYKQERKIKQRAAPTSPTPFVHSAWEGSTLSLCPGYLQLAESSSCSGAIFRYRTGWVENCSHWEIPPQHFH